ncbi:MAG: S41 family peptidase [Bacillota bacterium]
MKKKILIFLLASFLIFTTVITGIAQNTDDYNKTNAFQDIIFLIKNYYVEDVELDTLLEGAIDGMLNKVDRFSYYMDAEEYEEMQTEYEGHYGGIGIVITTRDNKLTVVSPIKKTPGERAGLQAGDIIAAIDGVETSEISQMKAVDLMRGEPGTDVVLTVERADLNEPLEITITREDIEVPYVESEMKAENIGYISLAQFIENVGEDVETEIARLKEQGAEGIILDLRNNPGGLLNEAVNVASSFVSEGQIVSVRQRGSIERMLNANPEFEADTDIPVIVLINGGSASASEIVAGAIKDYGRGKLMGTKTFGKGVVQSVVPLTDGSAVSITTARYYTPDGNYIHEKGIEPDIEVELDVEAAQNGEDNQLDEAIDLMESFIIADEVQLKKAAGE